ncbi:MAG: GTP cyclohydrolase II, partial [Rhodobacteraceae bacterium]|nr:GTP cyclohydrolase II [Paracoccaceae bacterium]
VRCYDGDIARVSLRGHSGPDWVYNIADPSYDLASPMKGPLQALRTGPTDCARMAIRLTRKARLLPAVLLRETDGEQGGITTASIGELASCLEQEFAVRRVVSARLPLVADENARITVFRAFLDGDEHCAVEFGGHDSGEPALVRLHSSCFTGDVLASLKCDCGQQLQQAIEMIRQRGSGVLLYLNQEGRGIGLLNKIRAYSLQDQGFDTVEANHRLGFQDDERDFHIAASMLRSLGHNQVELITNNPVKVKAMEDQGIPVVNRLPILTEPNCYNRAYLQTKARKSGHLMKSESGFQL